MYLYRAINEEHDLKSYIKREDITAKINITKDFMKSVAQHVSNGSNSNYQDCWISTTKNFKICASEYAIPQNGGYNTANAVLVQRIDFNSDSNIIKANLYDLLAIQDYNTGRVLSYKNKNFSSIIDNKVIAVSNQE